MRIIKNPSSNLISTIFRGRKVVIKPKGSLTCPDGEEGEALFFYLTQTFAFLLDRTPEVHYEAPKTDAEIRAKVKVAKGVKTKR